LREILLQVLPALGQRLGMRENNLDFAFTTPYQTEPDGKVHLVGDGDLQVQQKVHDHGYCSLQTVLHGNDCNVQLTRLNGPQGILKIAEVDKFGIVPAF
jgi:hypothetical protein